MKDDKLLGGEFYHIYNCGINGMDLFRESENYEHFLNLMDKYILPVAEIFAWVLMRNHFHLLVRIKENVRYKYSLADRDPKDDTWFDEHKWETFDLSLNLSTSEAVESVKSPNNVKFPNPNLHFSHLFNSYSKYFNKRFTRHGGLFERRFERKRVGNVRYLKRIILYIHNNPVHHQFSTHPAEYPWSSYLTCISVKPTRLQRDAVLGWFDSETNFRYLHDDKEDKIELEKIEKWIGLKY
jgi:REP element-mobilizing transposase RayT